MAVIGKRITVADVRNWVARRPAAFRISYRRLEWRFLGWIADLRLEATCLPHYRVTLANDPVSGGPRNFDQLVARHATKSTASAIGAIQCETTFRKPTQQFRF